MRRTGAFLLALALGAVVAGVFVGGRFVEGPRFRAMSYHLLDAFIVNWGYTTVGK